MFGRTLQARNFTLTSWAPGSDSMRRYAVMCSTATRCDTAAPIAEVTSSKCGHGFRQMPRRTAYGPQGRGRRTPYQRNRARVAWVNARIGPALCWLGVRAADITLGWHVQAMEPLRRGDGKQ